MKIKFDNVDQIASFLNITQKMTSDVIIKEGSLQLDGKSSIGMMEVPLHYAVEVYLIDKKGINETAEFIKRCMAIGVCV